MIYVIGALVGTIAILIGIVALMRGRVLRDKLDAKEKAILHLREAMAAQLEYERKTKAAALENHEAKEKLIRAKTARDVESVLADLLPG